jgi:PAS domain S-box-containing protein
VWVLDDSPVETDVIRRALLPDCEVVTFLDGAVLLEALGQQPAPDLLVLDWQLPGLSGVEVCRFLRGSRATEFLPVVLLTANTRSEDVAEGLAAGANDYVFKPFRAVELSARVHAQVRRDRMRRLALSDEHARRQLAENSLSEVQAAEARASRSELRFRLAARATRDAVWEWDPRTDAVDWTGGAAALFRYEGEGVRDTREWWVERIHPEDRERVMRTLRAAVAGTAHEWQEAYRFLRGDGTWAFVVDRCHIVRDAHGRALQAVGAMQDVTDAREAEAERARLLDNERHAWLETAALARALRESEERLRSALAAARLGTWRLDLRTDTDVRDAHLNRILGLEEREGTFPLDDFLSRVHPDDRSTLQEALRRTARERTPYDTQCRILLPGGAVRWVRGQGHVLLGADGEPTHLTGTLEDITEHKQMVAERQRRAEFERQLIGIVSHDLRNPLTTITLATSMLLQRPGLDTSQQRDMRRIQGAADRAVRLIRDLLDFTLARQGGSLPVQPRPMDLRELVRGVVEELQPTQEDRAFQVEHSGDVLGEWDPDRLAQVLVNLVGNALQYSPTETPVRVSTRGGPDGVTLSVHNGGSPIQPDLLPRIFEPLERGVGIDDRERRSIGLGLYIVHHIVQAHGGAVEVHSTLEQGTTFTVRLPRRSTPTPAQRPEG